MKPIKVGRDAQGNLGELSDEFPYTDEETELLVLKEDGSITYDDGVDGYKGPQWALLLVSMLAGVARAGSVIQ